MPCSKCSVSVARLKSDFLACVEECISERESRRFEEGLNTKVKLNGLVRV